VLQYHVIAGQTLDASILLGRNGETEATVNGESVSFSVSDALFVDESRVVRTDIFATNGVAHAIDTVLIPDNVNLGGNTLWTIVENDSRFTKLKKLLELTGLDAEFKNSTAYTGFLPTNEAFHRLNSDGNKWWYYMAFTKQDVHYATKLLKMHVAAGTFDRASLLRSGSVTNLKGVRMDVKETQNCKTVDTHSWKWTWFKWNWVKTGTRQECGDTLTYVYKTYNQIIQSDITAKNGIAHVINYPLIPR
ncbi:MAG: fasciclin domain-containing protein, partial [Granulosicoccus sp.]